MENNILNGFDTPSVFVGWVVDNVSVQWVVDPPVSVSWVATIPVSVGLVLRCLTSHGHSQSKKTLFTVVLNMHKWEHHSKGCFHVLCAFV